jgi:hypothetical protein
MTKECLGQQNMGRRVFFEKALPKYNAFPSEFTLVYQIAQQKCAFENPPES